MESRRELTSNQLTLAINDLIENIQDTFKKLVRQESDHIHLAINDLLESWLEFTRRVILNPDRLAHVQLVYWQDYLLLCKDLQQRLADVDTTAGSAAKQKILLAFIDKFSFLISQHIPVVFRTIFTTENGEDTRKIDLFTRQFMEAFKTHLRYPDSVGNLA